MAGNVMPQTDGALAQSLRLAHGTCVDVSTAYFRVMRSLVWNRSEWAVKRAWAADSRALPRLNNSSRGTSPVRDAKTGWESRD